MIINVLFFIFKYFNDDNRMIINIIIEPVSGSKKVRTEGIKVIIVNVMNVLFLIIKLLKSSIKLSFVSSLGWNEKLNTCIHALDPFITLPNIKTYISSTKLIMYRGIMNFFRYLKFIFVDINNNV